MNYDVILIGAGPAGTAEAIFLTRAGFKVAIYEKEQFPRFHIGESLIPGCMPTLHALALDLESAPYALKKGGALFISENDQRFRISFDKTLPGTFPHAYQVERAAFDEALAVKAEASGVDVFYERKVTHWDEKDDGVVVHGDWGTARCRYLIDTTGQDALRTRANKSRQRVRGMGRCATFSHYRIRPDRMREVFDQGDTLVLCGDQGKSWGWGIPLPGNVLSLGCVGKDGQRVLPLEETMEQLPRSFSIISYLLEGAEKIAVTRRIANFSYYNAQPHSARTLSLGDAYGFLDPVFSSGVTLALVTAHQLKDHLIPNIIQDQPLQLDAWYLQMQRGYQTFERVVDRFYRPGWVENMIFVEDKTEELTLQLNTILAGDVWRHDNPLQNRFLANTRRAIRFEDPE